MNQLIGCKVVLFQGDSITDCERNREDLTDLGNGYPRKVAKIYKSLFPNDEITFINRGISGNRVYDLLERYEKDFKEIKPDFISILIGINDVWRRYDSGDITTLEQFKNSYYLLLSKIKEDMPDTKIMIIEPFVLHTLEDRKAWHEDLDPKILAVRELAMEFADFYLPTDGILQKYIIEGYSQEDVAVDGVHPTKLGHGLIAKEYLKALSVI